MADLNTLQAADTVRIAGANTSGVDDNFADVDSFGNMKVVVGNTSANPVPVQNLDYITSGTISAADSVVTAPAGDGTFRIGASTAGSYVSAQNLGGNSSWDIQLTGTMSGIYYFEESLDSTNGQDGNWINVNGRQTGLLNTALAGNATLPGFYRGNSSGAKWVRVRNVGGSAPSTTVKISLSQGPGSVFLNASIPSGANIIGGVALGSILNLKNGVQASVFGSGELRVQHEPTQLFDDTFATTLDTANRWQTPVSAVGGVAAISSVGATTLGTGTTANGYSILVSQPAFKQMAPGWIEIHNAINLEFPIIQNTYRFWGVGLPQATPTAANPISDGMGFEIATNGKMYAVTYSAGTRFVIQDLSPSGNNSQPTDTAVHKYEVFYRADLAYWMIDTVDNIVATMFTGAAGPVNNTLPVLNLAIAGSTAPTSSGIITNNGVFVADTTSSNVTLSDGTYAWRKQVISSNGDAYVRNSINTALSNAAISVGTSAVEAKVGAAKLVGRKALLVTPTNGTVYWGSSNAVTVANGTPIFKNQSYPFDISDNVAVWLIAASTVDVRIVEGS
jgi:hypothetical protein